VYVSNFKNAINEVARLQETNPKFANYLQQKEEDEDLKTLLSIPINRISQYEYHIQAYKEHTIEGTQEDIDCQAAFSILQQSSKVSLSRYEQNTNCSPTKQCNSSCAGWCRLYKRVSRNRPRTPRSWPSSASSRPMARCH